MWGEPVCIKDNAFILLILTSVDETFKSLGTNYCILIDQSPHSDSPSTQYSFHNRPQPFFLSVYGLLFYTCRAFLVRKGRRQQTKTNTLTENQIGHQPMVFCFTSIYSLWKPNLATLPALLTVKESQIQSLNVIIAGVLRKNYRVRIQRHLPT